MVDLKAYLYEKVKPIINGWDEEGIYAISFFVNSNLAYTYQQYNNVSEFAISYNTEEDCGDVSEYDDITAYDEERWEYANWRQNTTFIIDPNENNNEGMEILFQWYRENRIENIGYEDGSRNAYDENMQYIGKGPIGYYELLSVVSDVARQLQTEGFISEKFGNIPIIMHALGYCWYLEEATAHANPNGEADEFFAAMKRINEEANSRLEAMKMNAESPVGESGGFFESLIKLDETARAFRSEALRRKLK